MEKLVIKGVNWERFELKKGHQKGFICIYYNYEEHTDCGNVFLVDRLTKRGLTVKGMIFGNRISFTISSKFFDFREVEEFLSQD